jgi:hypothetical protein
MKTLNQDLTPNLSFSGFATELQQKILDVVDALVAQTSQRSAS